MLRCLKENASQREDKIILYYIIIFKRIENKKGLAQSDYKRGWHNIKGIINAVEINKT